MKNYLFTLASAFALAFYSNAQETVKYTGNTLSNVDYHHGQLTPAIGVHNIQVMRANREQPDKGDGFGWTYNHAPMLAYWNNTFYLQYLSDSVSEHVPPGQTFLVHSKDGYSWSKPDVVFPRYRIPDGTTKEGVEGTAKNLYAVMHQRMGFFVSSDNRLLTLAYYGICLNEKDKPNDGKGIGRVVREIKTDGSYGPIYFIRYNSAWNESNTIYPFYTKSKDKEFVEACKELLANPLMMQQWVEEADRDDPLIPLKKQFKALSYYHLPDGRVVGLWKHALTAISTDEGVTWPRPERAPGFVNRNAKIWGQKTSDGRYAIIYNPSQFRWPLAVSTSDNGLTYNDLLLVNGEITSMRYGGNQKSYGPQYVRGILEGNGQPPDGKIWVTYSMNKEDIWVSSIPVPVIASEQIDVNDVFSTMPDGHELDKWNIFSPLWAPVKIEKDEQGEKCLTLRDYDNFDYAVAERTVPSSKNITIEFTIKAGQKKHGLLHIEFVNNKGNAAIRLIFDNKGEFINKDGYGFDRMIYYESNHTYLVRAEIDVNRNSYDVYINNKKEATRQLFAPVNSIDRIIFRTGERRYYPNPDSPGKQDFDVPGVNESVEPAVYYIYSLKTYNLK